MTQEEFDNIDLSTTPTFVTSREGYRRQFYRVCGKQTDSTGSWLIGESAWPGRELVKTRIAMQNAHLVPRRMVQQFRKAISNLAALMMGAVYTLHETEEDL